MAGILNQADKLSELALTQWLRELRGRAYAKQSHFHVAAVFRAKTPAGIVHVGGANVEHPDLTLGTCAEESAMAALVTAYGPEVELLEGWVMGAPAEAKTSQIPCTPCGECRQRLAHFAGKDALVHAITLDGVTARTISVGALLPEAFSFRNLDDGAAKAASSTGRAASPESASANLARHDPALSERAVLAWLNGLHSDARATRRHQAVLLRTQSGGQIAGVRIENAAYPTSTEAMQSAVANLRGIYGTGERVTEAWVLSRGETTPEPTLSGAELHILWEAARGANIPVHDLCTHRTDRLHTLLPHAPIFAS